MSHANLGYCIALISLALSFITLLFAPEMKIIYYLLILPLLVGIVLIGLSSDKQEKGT